MGASSVSDIRLGSDLQILRIDDVHDVVVPASEPRASPGACSRRNRAESAGDPPASCVPPVRAARGASATSVCRDASSSSASYAALGVVRQVDAEAALQVLQEGVRVVVVARPRTTDTCRRRGGRCPANSDLNSTAASCASTPSASFHIGCHRHGHLGVHLAGVVAQLEAAAACRACSRLRPAACARLSMRSATRASRRSRTICGV